MAADTVQRSLFRADLVRTESTVMYVDGAPNKS